MKKIKEEKDLMLIVGGINWTGTIVNAFTSAAKFIYSVGQSFGSAIRRISSNNMCSCK